MEYLKKRFDQPGYNTYSNLEQLLIKTVMKEDYELHLKAVCNFYKNDIKPEILSSTDYFW